MIDIDRAISVARLLVVTAEALTSAVAKAKQALEAGTEQLKGALAEIEKMCDQIAADRKEADDALDRKFDGSKDEP